LAEPLDACDNATGGDISGEGTGVDDVDSVSLGATASGVCVLEPEGGALGGVDEFADEFVVVFVGAFAVVFAGAIDAPGVAAGAIRCLAPRPSMLPVA